MRDDRPRASGFLLALAASLATLAGCAAPGTPAEDPAPGGPGAVAAEPRNVTLYLHPGGVLAETPPAEGRVPMRWSWGEYAAHAPPPTWTGPSAESAYAVLSATVTYRAVAEGPTAGRNLRPEFTAWWGAGESWVSHTFFDGPDVLTPGQVVEVTMPQKVPVGGLLVEAGTAPVVRVASYYADGERAGAVALLLGGEAASRVEMTLVPVEVPALLETGRHVKEGDLVGGICFVPQAVPVPATATIPLEVPESAVLVRVTLTRTGGEGPPDMDFGLLSPNGTWVAGGEGSMGDETVLLHRGNLEAAGFGEWQVFVFTCAPQRATFRLEARVFEAGP